MCSLIIKNDEGKPCFRRRKVKEFQTLTSVAMLFYLSYIGGLCVFVILTGIIGNVFYMKFSRGCRSKAINDSTTRLCFNNCLHRVYTHLPVWH